MHPIKEKSVINFIKALILIGCDYSKGNGRATNEVMTQQWNKYAHLTNNAKCNFVEWKTGYATTWDA